MGTFKGQIFICQAHGLASDVVFVLMSAQALNFDVVRPRCDASLSGDQWKGARRKYEPRGRCLVGPFFDRRRLGKNNFLRAGADHPQT